MSIAASVKHIAPVARALTEGNRMVALKSAFAPVGEVALSLQNPARANRVGFGERVAMESEDAFTKANEIIVGADSAAIEDQVAELTRNVNAMVFTARNVIVPTVDGLVNGYLARKSAIAQPNVAVNVFKYHDVHSEPALVNHLVGKYTQIQAFKEYRSFILASQSAEQIVTLVSENNPHLEQSKAVEWLLEMGAERIQGVWASLFGKSRAFDTTGTPYLRSNNLPLMIDELLLAYCLTGALLETPQDVIGESVDLPEWERALGILHEFLGHKLVRAYEYRAQDAKTGRLIIASDGKDGIRTGVVSVLVNGDIYNGWLSSGGDIQALLGAAVYEPQLKTITALNAVAEDLSKRWMSYYPIMRQTCLDNSQRSNRKAIADVFMDSSIPTVEGLPQLDAGVVRQRLDAELRALKDDALAVQCPFRLFADLVCRVYFREQPLFVDFLHALDRYSKIHPEASGRELAIESTLEMIATWLASQITTVGFKPDVDPNATLSTEESINVQVDSGNQETAEDLGDVVEETPEADPVEEFMEEEEGESDPVTGESEAEESEADATPDESETDESEADPVNDESEEEAAEADTEVDEVTEELDDETPEDEANKPA